MQTHRAVKFVPFLRRILQEDDRQYKESNLGLYVKLLVNFAGIYSKQPKLRFFLLHDLSGVDVEEAWEHLYIQPTCSFEFLHKRPRWPQRQLGEKEVFC